MPKLKPFQSTPALKWRAAALVGLLLTLSGCSKSEGGPSPAAAAELPKPVGGKLTMEVTKDGFVPAKAQVEVGKPVTLVITRKEERTCATEIVIKDLNINQELPLGKTVEVTLTPTKPGPIHFACAMDMITGDLIAQ